MTQENMETPTPPASSEMEATLTQEVPAPPKKEEDINLNELFPEEDQNLNDLFPEQDLRSLLKKINKNKTDLSKINDRFRDAHILDDEDEEDPHNSGDSND